MNKGKLSQMRIANSDNDFLLRKGDITEHEEVINTLTN